MALIVDDNADIRDGVARLLGHAGLEVRTAKDGTEAMARFWQAHADKTPFRLIVLDLAMPHMDGATAAIRMRNAERELEAEPAYILGFTGKSKHLFSEDSLKCFDDVMEKPGEPQGLKDLALRVCGE